MTATFDLTEDDQGRLVLHLPEQEPKTDVRVRRAFPWSRPGKFVSIRDTEGKELLLIEDLDALPSQQRKLLERWLADTSFIPRITKVHDVDLRFGYQQWKVETDRGPADFRVQEREDIRFLPDGRFRVKDADGNVYELPPVQELDEPSRKAMEVLI